MRTSPRLKTLGILALVLTATACAVGMTPTVRTVVMQREASDCVIATVAMMGGWTYERVEFAAQAAGLSFRPHGLSTTESVHLLESLGADVELRPAPTLGHLGQAKGLLVVRYPGAEARHAVYIERGFIYDPMIPHVVPWVLWFRDSGGGEVEWIVVME